MTTMVEVFIGLKLSSNFLKKNKFLTEINQIEKKFFLIFIQNKLNIDVTK